MENKEINTNVINGETSPVNVTEKVNTPVKNAKRQPRLPKEKMTADKNRARLDKPNARQNAPKQKTNKKPVTNTAPESTADNVVAEFSPINRTMRTLNIADKRQKKTDNLKIMFLGGVGEIGKNMTVFEYKNDIFVLDCGLIFPSDDMLGIDLVVPDITYLEENKDRIRGIVITHAHEDHIGALPYVLDTIKAPVYGSKMTLGFIARKFEEHRKISYKANAVKEGQKIKLGCFEIEFIHVNHSIPGAFGVAIKTPVGMIVHTGDFKIDFCPIKDEPLDLNRFAEIGNQGVLLYMADSTNADRPGYSLSESVVKHTMEQLFEEHKDRRIIVATFASNLHRLQEIMRIAGQHKRKVMFAGRSMIANTDVAAKIGEMEVDKKNIVDIDKVNKLADNEVCIFCTGSQGEPMSALSRMASGEFKGLTIGNNDTIIFSSSPIPGNERAITNTINALMAMGAKIIYNQLADVHASGHAKQEELKTMLSIIKPKYFIPVHGEICHLMAHKQLATSMRMDERNIIIASLGDKVEVNKNFFRITGSVPFGSRLIDGSGVGEMDSNVLRERKQLSEDGLCVIILNINTKTASLCARPEIMSRGFTYHGEAEVWLNEAKENIINSCESVDLTTRDYQQLKLTVKKNLTNFLNKRLQRKPLIIPIIVES